MHEETGLCAYFGNDTDAAQSGMFDDIRDIGGCVDMIGRESTLDRESCPRGDSCVLLGEYRA